VPGTDAGITFRHLDPTFGMDGDRFPDLLPLQRETQQVPQAGNINFSTDRVFFSFFRINQYE
jgi:hypothetical protein